MVAAVVTWVFDKPPLNRLHFQECFRAASGSDLDLVHRELGREHVGAAVLRELRSRSEGYRVSDARNCEVVLRKKVTAPVGKLSPEQRVRLSEVTPARIVGALRRRVDDIFERIVWSRHELAVKSRARLERYRNVHKGERCFVIANGPSVAKMNLRCLRDEYTMCMNRAYLMFETWGFEPNYYVCINDLVLEQFADDISRLAMPRFVNFHSRHFFDNAAADTSIIFLRLGLYLRDWFSRDIARPVASGGTVTFVCLQLAYFMGFSEVIIVGLDHDFVDKGVPNTAVVRNSERDENHCHPDYFPKGVKWELPDLYRSELAYRLARQAFESDGRRIIDATVEGKCAVFEKAVLGDVLTPGAVA